MGEQSVKAFTIALIWLLLIPGTLLAEVEQRETAPALDNCIVCSWQNKTPTDPHESCAKGAKEPHCVWAGELSLDITEQGGAFNAFVRLDTKEKFFLPGNLAIWPQNVHFQDLSVLNNNSQASHQAANLILREQDGRPYVILEKGEHLVGGEFFWSEMPEYIPLPSDIGKISLRVNGKNISMPQRNERSEIWLRSKTDLVHSGDDRSSETSTSIEVARKLSDGIPQQLESILTLRISGVEREENLGVILPDGFIPVRVASTLPNYLDSQNNFHIQVKPGSYEVRVFANIAQPVTEIKAVLNKSKGWPEAEYWAWQGDKSFREVKVSGDRYIDASRALVPPEWKLFTLFLLKGGEKLQFEEERQETANLNQNQINLQRKFKLDSNGDYFTVIDQFSGTMMSDWRMNINREYLLGKVETAKNKLLVTEDPKSKLHGVEVRSKTLNLVAESRLKRESSIYSAIGWDTEVKDLAISLELPPNWLVLWNSGSDDFHYSWQDRWSANSVIVIGILSALAIRFVGLFWGLGFSIFWILAKGELGAPVTLLFLSGLIGATGLKYENTSWLLWSKRVLLMLAGLLCLRAISFTYSETENIFAPNLYYGYLSTYGSTIAEDSLVRNAVGNLFALTEGAFGALVMILAGVGVAISIFVMAFSTRNRSVAKKIAIICAVLAITAFCLRALVSLFFGEHFEAGPMSSPAPKSSSYSDAGSYAMNSEFFSKSGTEKPHSGENSGDDKRRAEAMRQLNQLDSNAIVQTGYGLPSWSGNQTNLNWSGRVKKDAQFRVILLPPMVVQAIAVLRMLLLWILIFALAVRFKSDLFSKISATNTAVALLLFLVFPPPGVSENNKNINSDVNQCRLSCACCAADKLQEKDPFACEKSCTIGERLKFAVNGQNVSISAIVHASADASWGIPGPLRELYVYEVLVDGQVSKSLTRDTNDFLWVRLAAGVHNLAVQAELRSNVLTTLTFPVKPGAFETVLTGWSIQGAKDFAALDSFTLTRSVEARRDIDPDSNHAGEGKENLLPFWYRIKREVTLSLPWTVKTTVFRDGEFSRPSIIKIPMLPGESITDAQFEVQNKFVLASFPTNVSSVSWEGTIPIVDEFVLRDSSLPFVSEEWLVQCSDIFACDFDGTPPVATTNALNMYELRWLPWQGDKVKIAVTRPLGMKGKIYTFKEVTLAHTINSRQTLSQLTFRIDSSQGGVHYIKIPEGSRLVSGSIDQRPWNFTKKGNEISLPLQPSTNTYSINLERDNKTDSFYLPHLVRLPDFDLNSDAVDVRVIVTKTENSNFFYYSSNQPTYYKPVTLFWINIVFMFLTLIAVRPFCTVPISFASQMTISTGLALSCPTVFFLFIGWLLSVSYLEKRYAPKESSMTASANRQKYIRLLTAFLALSMLYSCAVLTNALPTLAIHGHGSNARSLTWTFDRIASTVPSVQVLLIDNVVLEILATLWVMWLLYRIYLVRKWLWKQLFN